MRKGTPHKASGLMARVLLNLGSVLPGFHENRKPIKEAYPIPLATNHPIGSLALVHMVAPDTLIRIREGFHTEPGEDKYRQTLLLLKTVRTGYLGRKNGKGFYDDTK